MTIRVLLINPRFPESFWSFKWALEEILPKKRAINPPLGLATLAALCPAHWTVEIIDENIEPVPLKPDAQIIGVCGMGAQFQRQSQLLAHYRSIGYFVVAGGSFASLCPEKYESLADCVIAGEAEHIWPEFCRDYERGQCEALYQERGTVALSDSPVPRFDLLKLEKYSTATLQFSRGCPYLCEFCDIIVMFGRKPRCKTLEQVGLELDALRARNITNVFFVDDNLIGHKALAKDLLRYLRDYQARHRYQFRFGTEASLNMAQDEELLQLFRDANFTWVFIGIESPDAGTLRDTRKTQNTHEDVLTSVRRIYTYGVDVLAGFIVGFDRDTVETFDVQYRFIRDAGLQVAMVGLLTALPKTPLYERLKREGRLIEDAEASDNTKVQTNIVPKGMSYDELIRGYTNLYRRLLSDNVIAQRVRNKLRHMPRPVYHGEYSRSEQLAIVMRVLTSGILRGGGWRLFHFVRSIPWCNASKLPLALVDWIAGLAMRDYMDRHFMPANPRAAAVARGYLRSLRRATRRYLEAGAASVELLFPAKAAPRLCIRLKGNLDSAFFSRCSRRLVGLMRRTPSSITLSVEELEHARLADLHRLLRRLARYGDRIFIDVNEKLQHALDIDSSVFHLVLPRRHTAGR